MFSEDEIQDGAGDFLDEGNRKRDRDHQLDEPEEERVVEVHAGDLVSLLRRQLEAVDEFRRVLLRFEARNGDDEDEEDKDVLLHGVLNDK